MTTQVIVELDEILNLLESELPANINSVQNQRLEDKLRKSLTRYFKALENAFPYDRVDEIYYRHVKESLGGDTGDMLDPLLAVFGETLKIEIERQLVEIYISGSAEMVTWGQTLGGIPIAYEGPPSSQAINYAEKHCAKLVTQMGEETKRRLAKVISDGIANKRGIPGLVTDIKRELGWMGRGRPSAIKGLTMQGRAYMIARTETNDALSQAFMDRAKDMGIEAKEVVGGGNPCPLCQDNIGDGIIPLNQAFSSGHMRPPFHPNCICALAPARLGGK